MIISCRLQSGKTLYITKNRKVSRKIRYNKKTREEKNKQYSGVLKLLGKKHPIKYGIQT